ncbi:hypothetical protein Tco_0830682 [Tanacetum coccineum]
MDMFRVTLKLLVETVEQPFIPPANFDYIWPFLKILGYQGPLQRVIAFFYQEPCSTVADYVQGHVDNVSLMWSDLLHCVMQKKNSIQYPRFTKLIIVDLIEKYESIPKRLEEEYHTIKDDTPLVSVYTTGEVIVRGMQIPNDLLTDAIRDTQAYKDYVEKYERVEVPTIQPEPVESTQGMHRKPRATRTPKLDVERDEIIEATQLRLTLDKTAKVYEEQQNVAAVVKKILEEDVENLIEGEDESDGDEFADTEIVDDDDDRKNEDDKHDDAKDDDDNDDDDHDDHSLIRTWKTGSSGIRTEKMKTPIPSPPRSPRIDLSLDKAIDEELIDIIKKVNESLKEIIPKLATSTTNDLINDNIPKLVTDAVKKERESSQPTNTLKAKYEKSSALIDFCRYDAFRKRDHGEHQGGDAPPERDKGAKRQKTSRSSKSVRGSSSKQHAKETNTSSSSEQLQQQDLYAWVDILVIDKDEVIPKEETPELIDEFQNVDKRVVWESRQEELKRPQPEALVLYGPQRNLNETPQYFYNKDLFFLKNGNTDEKKKVLKTFNEEARLSIQHWKDLWHKRMYKIKNRKVRDDPEEERVHDFQLGIESYQIKINLTALTLTFYGIEACNPYSIVDKPYVGLIYLNNKQEKRIMDLVDISKFCDATLEKVLIEVTLKTSKIEFKMKTPLLGKLNLKIMKAYDLEILKHLNLRK